MQPEEDIFSEAISLPKPARPAFLDRACAADVRIRQRVEALLAAAIEAPEFLNTPLVVRSDVPSEEQCGDQIGRYRLVHVIGEGGCGVVWLADQLEPVHRRVALKVIKLGMDTREVITRFEAERQALALMDHPNIARVFDAGATTSGRPFFVMEFVQGETITHYCDEHRLAVEARLRLFIAVCRAVQHAHQKGVIHRDLKPSNILVSTSDGTAVPKIIDFGIAKATDAHLTEKTLVTRLHAFLGTPAYASPEQMEMGATDIDTRSDIYSLGVLLYEVLCGRPPFDADALAKASLEAARRTIREVDPPRPSAHLATLSQEERAAVARHRVTDAARLSLLLRGDLDWIVMRCLEKDRRRRYDTATGLAADIERHLAHEPVTARPPSRLYRASKHIRRHRIAVATGTVFLLGLASAAVFSTWQAVRATRAEQVAVLATQEQSRLRAQAEAQALAMRRLAYASDMKQAHQALQRDDLAQTLALLDRQRPAGGAADLRGWEWRHLWLRSRSESLSTLNSAPFVASSIAVSHDGRWLATVRKDDGVVELWDLETRAHQPIPLEAAAVEPALVAFSPTGTLLAVHDPLSEFDRPGRARVVLWDYATEKQIATWTIEHQTLGGPGVLKFSADGTKLFAALGSDPVICSVPDGRIIRRLTNGSRGYGAISPDFGAVAFEAGDNSVRVSDAETGEMLWQAKAAVEFVNAVAFSPDGRILATAGGGIESSIQLWDTATGSPLGSLEGHHASVQRLLFWPDGRTLASGSNDQTIRLWDLSSRSVLRRLRGHRVGVHDLALMPDGAKLVSASRDGTIRFWDAREPSPADTSSELGSRVVRWRFAPDSQSIVTLDAEGRVRRWHGPGFRTCEELMEVGPVAFSYESSHGRIGFPMSACLARDRPLLAVSKRNRVVEIWDWDRRTLEREIPAETGAGTAAGCIGFVDQGRKLLVNWANTEEARHGVWEWDLATGERTRSWTYPGPGPWPQSLLAADGRRCLVSWGENPFAQRPRENAVTLIDLESGAERSLPGIAFWWWDSAALSADGRIIAAPLPASTTIWELPAQRLVRTVAGTLCAAFTPDGRRLAFGDGRIWDTESWEQVFSLEAQRGHFFSAEFSPDGNVFAAWTQFNELYLWRAPSWEEVDAAEAASDAR
jgi:serine/threonine protein kinase/WD40 repeat protein